MVAFGTVLLATNSLHHSYALAPRSQTDAPTRTEVHLALKENKGFDDQVKELQHQNIAGEENNFIARGYNRGIYLLSPVCARGR